MHNDAKCLLIPAMQLITSNTIFSISQPERLPLTAVYGISLCLFSITAYVDFSSHSFIYYNNT